MSVEERPEPLSSEDPLSLPTDPEPEPAMGEPLPRRRRPIRAPRLSDETGLSHRIAGSLSTLRDERQARMSMPVQQRSTYEQADDTPRRAKVPYGVDLAAAWSWRFVIVVIALSIVLYALAYLEELVLPIIIALLITALVVPAVELLERIGVRRGLASLLVVIVLIAVVASLLALAGQQIANGAQDLANQATAGLRQIRDYLHDGPFHVSEKRIDRYIASFQSKATEYAEGKGLGQVTEVGTKVGKGFAGLFVALLSMYFFLADGAKIWSWIVRLSPRDARERVDSSGRVAWISLTQFVRATVIVAVTDAILTATAAAVLQVPFVLAIGVLVFLGAFIPLVGATVAGSVAVLVALVDRGPVVALIMLAAVIIVQQIEAHGLQPFLMGRWVSVHPLGVIVAIGTGIIVAGVVGALVAVPLAAALNAVGLHLASGATPAGAPGPDIPGDTPPP